MLRALLLVLMLSGAAQAAPQRVVSINLCTDQLAMLLAAPGQLVSVSWLAADPASSALAAEVAIPLNHAGAEEVHGLAPDLVLAGTYTTRATVDLLRRLGVRVEEFAPAASFGEIRAALTRMGALLGREARATALTRAMDMSLAGIEAGPAEAVLWAQNGWTSGEGTLADAIIRAAGFRNLTAEHGVKGLGRLPMEMLVMRRPDLLVTPAPAGAPSLVEDRFAHPVLDRLPATAAHSGPRWVCGAPFTAHAAAALSAVR